MSRRGSALGAAIAALFVLLATIPAAGETDVDYAGVVREKYLYNTDPAIDASVSDTRIELDIGIGELTIGAVYRAYLLSNDGYNPAGVTGDPIRIKHRYIALVHDDILLRAGHFFETFGHGLTLRSFEDVDLEYDTALDGLLADYSAGHVVPFLGDVSVTALTGTATHDVPGTAYYDYVVNAARVAMPVSEYGEIAGSVVERSETQKDEEVSLPDDAAKSKDAVVGYELSVWMGPLALAGEYASRHSNGETSGHALYGSGTLDLGWVTLFGELKDYEDYDYYMVNPPTAVRDHLWTLMNRATYEIDLNDERGFLIEGSAPVGDAAYLLGGASEARSHDWDLRHWEMYVQTDLTLGEMVTGSVAASWSREYLFVLEEATGKFDDRKSAALGAEVELGNGQAVELTLEGQVTDSVEVSSYEDYIASIAYYPGAGWTLIGTLETTTSETESSDSWFMGEVRKQVSDDLDVSLAAGMERGGKKCTGGICFDEPEFEGVRLRFTRYF